MNVEPQIEKSWKAVLDKEFHENYFSELKLFLIDEKKKHVIFPPGKKIFSAFNRTPFEKVKVVIIGQDPYHGAGQANGLCFSVSDGIKQPPSLVNIFKELIVDQKINFPKTGNLEPWADQGILLLNATLTVRENEAGAHQQKGWERFTDKAIQELSVRKSGLVFLLWGKYAQAKETLIDTKKHHVLKAAHPSPFSAYNGFFGCKHFSKTNELLVKNGQTPINWMIN